MAGGKMAASAVYERLTELGCPVIEGIYLSDVNDIQKLLCTPSALRMEILEWICVSVYPPIQKKFASLKDSQSDLKIKRMVKLGYDLMLCQAEDLDLITGNAPAQKQLRFLKEFLAVVPPKNNFTASSSSLDGSIFSSSEESFQEIARKNEEFVKQVFSSPDLQAVLNPECHPWNSDMKALLLGEDALQKRTHLSKSFHERTLLERLKELKEVVAAFQVLKSQCPFLQGDLAGEDATQDDSGTALQTLKLIASDYNQLLLAFEQVYENELEKHCSRPAPRLSPCGPLFQEVHQALLLCLQELQGLAQVSETSECITETVNRLHEEKMFGNGSAKSSLSSKLEELQQKYEAIHSVFKDCQ